MRRLLAGGLTAAVMGLVLWSGLSRPARDPAAPTVPDPDEDRSAAAIAVESAPDPLDGAGLRIRGLLDDARDGDLDAYLAAFDGAWRARLDREIAERGRAGFADELRQAARTRKGRAVFAPEPDGPDGARVVVETVYPDRNERQTFRLRRVGDGADWLVTDVELVRTRTPRAKYGSLATFGGPEGVPVPGGSGGAAGPAAASGTVSGP